VNKPRAVVVGSGPSGATVARVLALSGLYDVFVLEKGRNYWSGLETANPARVGNIWANDEINYEIDTTQLPNQDPTQEPRSFRTDPSAGPRAFVGVVDNLATTVGGSFMHADVKARRFREVDLIANSLLGGSPDRPAIPGTTYADWAVTYQQIEPFYAVVEEVAGVQGPARRVGAKIVNPNPYESPRSTPFIMPPGVQQLNSLVPADAARRLGYFPAPVPTAANSRPYRGRPPCNDCGFCNDFGCPNNSKGGGVWQLVDAIAAGARLIAEANVIRVEWSGPAKGKRARATGVTWVDRSGGTHTMAADLVVLANNPIEATRLCLLSEISKPPDESDLSALIPTPTEPSGLLGRNLLLHLQTVVVAFLNQDIHSFRGRTSTQTLDAFAGPGPSPAQFNDVTPMGGLLEIGGNENPISQANALSALGFGSVHKLLMDLGLVVNRITSLTMQGQDMPQLTNYVDLDPEIVDVWGQPIPRVTYKNHPYELAAAVFYIPKMMEIMANIGGPGSAFPSLRTIFTAPLNTTLPSILPGSVETVLEPVLAATPFNDIPADKHIMGTHRFALDPAHGVTDPYGRMWAFDNLYVAGGALYPTSPGFNVTLTMYALSYWLGAAIVAGVGGAGSYTRSSVAEDWDRMLSVITRLDGNTMAARAIRSGQLVR
jgi:choline dehydrogenase-like flavoprotein